jgi:hypothetical protein
MSRWIAVTFRQWSGASEPRNGSVEDCRNRLAPKSLTINLPRSVRNMGVHGGDAADEGHRAAPTYHVGGRRQGPVTLNCIDATFKTR